MWVLCSNTQCNKYTEWIQILWLRDSKRFYKSHTIFHKHPVKLFYNLSRLVSFKNPWTNLTSQALLTDNFPSCFPERVQASSRGLHDIYFSLPPSSVGSCVLESEMPRVVCSYCLHCLSSLSWTHSKPNSLSGGLQVAKSNVQFCFLLPWHQQHLD